MGFEYTAFTDFLVDFLQCLFVIHVISSLVGFGKIIIAAIDCKLFSNHLSIDISARLIHHVQTAITRITIWRFSDEREII